MPRQNDENENNKASLPELVQFIVIIACVYCLMSLFGSSLTGEGGRQLGNYLRNSWGGPVIVIILFAMYISAAKLLKFRVLKLRRQFFGTIILYVSFAFMLGLLNESGWSSELTLLTAGKFGSGLAHFCVLNAGTFITLILVAACFILSAVFFGSKLMRLSIPKIPRLHHQRRQLSKNRKRRQTQRPSQQKKEEETETENIPDTDENPIPTGKIVFQPPKLKPAPEGKEINLPERSEAGENQDTAEHIVPVIGNAVEVIDNALALINSDELKPPVQKSSKPSKFPSKKLRRPLPAPSFTVENIQSENQDNIPEKKSPLLYDESAFPPPPELFGTKTRYEPDRQILKNSEKQAKTIITALRNFGVNASVAHIITGLTFIQYQLELSPGTKASRISGLADDLAISLAAVSVRIEAPIPGTGYIGIEVPCAERKFLPMRNYIESEEYKTSAARLPLAIGVQADGRIFTAGLEEMPHILVIGNRGSGRRMFVNASIVSMCSRRKPEELRLILIDTRRADFAVYDGLPHLLASPVTETDSSVKALTWAYDEVERRTSLFSGYRVRDLTAFNKKQKNGGKLPEIVIIISELADLIYSAGNEVESIIMRLSQKAGAAGIHMMIAAQSSSSDIITTMIKSNIPVRAVFSLPTEAESKNVIGNSDAVRLTGKGDMILRNEGGEAVKNVRCQAPFISEDKISEFVEYMFSNLEPTEMMKF